MQKKGGGKEREKKRPDYMHEQIPLFEKSHIVYDHNDFKLNQPLPKNIYIFYICTCPSDLYLKNYIFSVMMILCMFN